MVAEIHGRARLSQPSNAPETNTAARQSLALPSIISNTVKDTFTLADLQSWAPGKTKAPIRLGVFGHTVAHSLSPEIQNGALKEAGLAMRYTRFDIAPEELGAALGLSRDLEFVGVNLTVPHKIAGLALVDQADETARKIGAINTIKFERGKLRGFNTDGAGFARAIREEFSIDLRDLRILIVGAGGAARAIAWQCAKENCERLVIANRDLANANALCEELREFFTGPRVLGPVARLQAIALEEAALRFQVANVDLVVNATPLGLNRNDPLPVPARLIEPHLMIYDTVYSSMPTAFVSGAVESGARAADGLSMLLHQGALAFEIWFDRPAPIAAMRKALV